MDWKGWGSFRGWSFNRKFGFEEVERKGKSFLEIEEQRGIGLLGIDSERFFLVGVLGNGEREVWVGGLEFGGFQLLYCVFRFYLEGSGKSIEIFEYSQSVLKVVCQEK